MKHIKKALSWVLVLCMLLSLMPVGVFAADETEAADTFYKIVHVDAGRKYFSPENLKKIIDNAAAAGFNQVELYLSDNQGFRFALDDMTVTTDYGTYDLTPALGDGYSDGSKYPDGSGKYLTQSEMTDIISYATGKGIDIVPCINVPGHMGAILEEFPDFKYSGSDSSIDLANEKAVAFALAITEKYVTYFQSQGVKYYNVGADEYANDMSTMGFEGMGSALYTKFVEFMNSAADIVIAAGMTPRAFNDGFLYKDYSINVAPTTDYEICYWTSGWSGYDVAAASTLKEAGYKLINTHGDYYWILGGSQCTAEKAAGFDCTSFQGGTIDAPAGAMFCIWCDVGNTDGTDGGTAVVSATADVIEAFGKANESGTAVGVKPVAPVEETDSSSNVSVTAPELTGLTVKEATADPEISGATNIKTYSVTPTTDEGNYTGGAIVAMPIPEGWVADNVRAFVVNADNSVTTIKGVAENGTYSFVAPHFSDMGLYETEATSDTNADIEVTENETITVTAGGTATATIKSYNFAGDYLTDDPSIATVKVTGDDGSIGTSRTLGSPLTLPSSIGGTQTGLITDGNSNYLKLDGTTVSNTTDIDQATVWTVTRTNNNGPATYTIQSENYYLGYSSSGNTPNALIASTSSTTWYYGNNGGLCVRPSSNYYYLRYNNGWQFTTNASDSNSKASRLYGFTEGTTSTAPSTTVIFTAAADAAGKTTYVTVGNTRYTINVIAEDLSKVDPLTVELWITNKKIIVTGDTNSMTISASEPGVYGESGALLSDFVPLTANQDDNTLVFWKGTRLDSSTPQTDESGVDKTSSGTDFTYIRYWNSSWAYSADGKIWTDVVASKDQIVAYYLQKTEVTEEVTTEVVDWGPQQANWSDLDYLGTKYVLLDFRVIYESGTKNPESFPTSNSLAFHCDTSSENLNKVTFKDGNYYYRHIGLIKAEETADYEVYMITLTPSSDNKGTVLASTPAGNTSYSYAGTEKAIWVDDEANLGDFADAHYTDPVTGDDLLTVGGEATVPGLKIYKQQGMLVTYYVRAKVTEDSLAVHYIDTATNSEFYNYNIAVKSGTLFDENISLGTPWKGDLANGSVTNLQNKTETVSADLSTMPAIGAQYRYSEYECIRVERSEDGKEVYLYYTFKNTHSFVVDFGLPLTITPNDLGISGNWTSVSVAGAKYGSATAVVNKGLTYTPTEMLQGVESLQLTLSDNTGSVTHQIYIYPATTVYYEEGFATYGDDWSGDSKGTGTQTTQEAGNSSDEYGYDAKYADENAGASNGTEAKSVTKGDTATFTFTGTGVDIYTNNTTKTGSLVISVDKIDGTAVKLINVDTVMADSEITTGQAVTGYNIPIASITGLSHGTYDVTIKNMTTEDGRTDGVSLDGFRIYGTMATEPDFYVNDDEDEPKFIELRDEVLTAAQVSTTDSQYASQIARDVYSQVYDKSQTTTGAIIMSANVEISGEQLQDLLDNGPKNEIYLQPEQALVFKITTPREVQIGLKALNASTTYTITGKTGDQPLSTSTDMFYTVLNKGSSGEQTITITNNGSGILSVTKLKICDDPDAALGELTEEDLIPALVSLGFEEDPETEEPEHTEHTWDEGVVTKEPTCTEDGVKTYTCTVDDCDETKTEVIAATGHSYDDGVVTTEATCTEDGVKTYTCTVCGDTKTEVIEATGHSYKDVVTEPTCTEQGYTTHTCENCGDTYTDSYTDETGHSYKDVVTEPTCTEQGYTTHTCENCGDTYTDSYTDAKGHSWDEGVVTKEPTETEDGIMTYTCTVEGCGATYTETISATSHTHVYDEGVVTKEPTCEEDGVKTYTCQDCGQTKTEVIAATGHSYSTEVTEPTCTEKGYTTYTCEVCGKTYTDDYTDALGHQYDEGTVIVEPTAATEGQIEYTCQRCQHSYVETIAATGNPFTDVPDDAWYADAVLWAVDQGITTGTTATTFAPDKICTRAQAVTFLWRAMNEPEPETTENPFTDVDPSQYYYKAVLWAYENGITTGTSPTKFSPDGSCTRAQVVTFLWRLEGKPVVETEVTFTDVDENEYYMDAIAWAVENKITEGVGNNKFSPDKECTRAHIVTFLYRYMAE